MPKVAWRRPWRSYLGLAFRPEFGDNNQGRYSVSTLKHFGIGLVLLVLQLSASAADMAVLRNGSQIPFLRKEQVGTITRLYIPGGHMDIPTDQIASFDKDDSALPDLPTDTTQPSSVNPTTAASSPAAPTVVPAAVLPAAAPAVVAPKVAVTQASIDAMVREAASKHQLDPDFVASVIKAESNFNPHAISPKGARGLMQLMPQTASTLGVTDIFDPKSNVEAGTAHLSALLDQYHNDPIKALAAYNAGAHRVQQYHGVPPYRETRAYVAAIIRDFNAKKRAELRAEAAKRKSAAAAKSRQNASLPAKQNQAQQQASVSNPQSVP